MPKFQEPVKIANASGITTIALDPQVGELQLGTPGDFFSQAGTIRLHGGDGGAPHIVLDGRSGDVRAVDVKLQGGDCAEEFDLASEDEGEPGTVMVLGRDGKLLPCEEPYDKRVAGIISGACGVVPGITLGESAGTHRRPLALFGRVFCRADADYAAIAVGDLLTTSTSRGYAMTATDSSRAFGAVIGKALRPMSSGRGLIPVLVTLQ